MVDHDTQTDDPEWLNSAVASRGRGGGQGDGASFLHGADGSAPVLNTGAVRISMIGAGHAGAAAGGIDLLDSGEGHETGAGEAAVWK